jgi:zinc D-Ala-D-Ala carboxypeptidase
LPLQTIIDNITMPLDDYEIRVAHALAMLGISDEDIARTRLPFHREPEQLTLAERGIDGTEHTLIPLAAAAWKEMKAAANDDGIELYVVSAFRDLASQADIVREKLERGMPLPTIFTLSAPPGYSEHHTGRAVDINTPGSIPREIPFEETAAFDWLMAHASRFGFVMSYPRNNALGFSYEPWHWIFVREQAG